MEGRWLSKGNCLRRFAELWDSIQEFLTGKELGQAVTPTKNDCFYLTDIFEKLYSINRELQGQNSDLKLAKGVINAFVDKLHIFRSNIGRHESSQFPMLSKVSNNISDNDLEVYIWHLKQLSEEMLVRFHDLIQMEIPDRIIGQFSLQMKNIDVSLQEALIDLQSDYEAIVRSRQRLHNLWLSIEMPANYPLLWVKAKLFLRPSNFKSCSIWFQSC
ncbi:hypothetical protein LOD99_5217 [Oopsacas minuta]|uniref:Uncharacterized protein n=1 Tax=Oopsacas minuta TaxID=111878 RepID=A0AAV7JST0_9METZ|nr:hypothetical protein LOD99_5217 [Oopsacas minuta]